MDKRRQSTVMLILASALVGFMWAEHFLLPRHEVTSRMGGNALVWFFSNIFVLIAVTLGILALLVALCIRSSVKGLHSGVRSVLVTLTIISIVLALDGFLRSITPRRNSFDRFCNTVTTNANFGSVVSWARHLLRERASDPAKGTIWISGKEVPGKVKALCPKQDGGPEVTVSIRRDLGQNQNFVVINFEFPPLGYGLFIGPSNLDIPQDKVSYLKKYEDGVFIFSN